MVGLISTFEIAGAIMKHTPTKAYRDNMELYQNYDYAYVLHLSHEVKRLHGWYKWDSSAEIVKNYINTYTGKDWRNNYPYNKHVVF